MTENKKIYFLSDFHLGAPDAPTSLIREKKIVQFLNEIKSSASQIFILGDIFDFWFEYKKVVPKGYVRILGKLAELADSGIHIHLFVGNHDMWMKDYFQKEMNISLYFEPERFELFQKKFLIGHGDGLGPGDKGYKFIKYIFRNPVSKWMFALLPPRIGFGLATFFSRKSRAKTGSTDQVFLGEDKEWLVLYCKQVLQHEPIDYFIFGHRHLPLQIQLNEKSSYLNSGDWIKYNSYIELDQQTIQLKYYKL